MDVTESVYAQVRSFNDNGALLGYYAASSGKLLPTFRDKHSVPSLGVKVPKVKEKNFSSESLTPEDETHGLYRNVGKKLPLIAA
jgi:hypothetical protein